MKSFLVRLGLLAAVVGCAESSSDEPDQKRLPPAAELRAIGEVLTSGKNPFVGQGSLQRLEQRLTDPALVNVPRLEVLRALAVELLRRGEIELAIERLNEAVEIAESAPRYANKSSLFRQLATAHLRQAETENCVQRHNAACCILPFAEEAQHTLRAPAEEARKWYEKALRLRPSDLEARWLLNVAVMALGQYPQAVPEKWRIPPDYFESDERIERFRDVAPGLGVDAFSMCGGVVVEDFDDDGLLDILTSTYDPLGPLTLYRNEGPDGFSDRSLESKASEQLGGLNMVAGDYDNDGDADVLLLRGAWLREDGRIRNSLLRTDADGSFLDVTHEAGLAEPAYPTQAALWGDFDDDGFLDLYVGNEARIKLEGEADYPSQLFHNEGTGRFTDVALEAGVENRSMCKGVAAGDYDNDGDLDLYVSNIGPNRLYRNAGDGTFADVASTAGVVRPSGRSFACWFFDYDNDGWLDLFAAAYQATLEDIAAEAFALPTRGDPPRLYANARDGTFDDVTRELGLDRMFLPMGANFGDLDNDGWLDVYLTTGEPQIHSLMPNVMLRNSAGTRFLDVTTSGGFGHLQKGHGVAFADLDNDGDQDIYHQLGGFFPVDRFNNALFENPGGDHHWIGLKLVGTRTNRGAVGTRVRLVLSTPSGTREIHRAAGSVSSFGGSPSRLEIGLGDATKIDRLEVHWPTSKERQVFGQVPLDAQLRIVEGEDVIEEISLEPFSFATQ